MQVIALVLVVLGSAAGLWFGLVDDIEVAFLAGVLGLAVATVAVFSGGYSPAPRRSTEPSAVVGVAAAPGAGPQRFVQTPAVLVAFLGGAAAMWFGLVEDLEWAFLLGLAAWALGTLLAFGVDLPLSRLSFSIKGPATGSTATGSTAAGTALFSALILLATFAGAAGIWFALVDDIEFLFAFGLIAWAGAFIAAFRGTASR